MADFTHKEKKAISKILSDLIRADGRVDIGEAESLFRISSTLGLNTQLQDEAMKLSSEEAIEILQIMPRDQRTEVVKFMHTMADSDGKFDQNEMNLILKIIHPS